MILFYKYKYKTFTLLNEYEFTPCFTIRNRSKPVLYMILLYNGMGFIPLYPTILMHIT